MINHISIGVHNPEKVANILAELWNGIVIPFPPCPNSFMVFANDGKGSGSRDHADRYGFGAGRGLPPEGDTSGDRRIRSEIRSERFCAAVCRHAFEHQHASGIEEIMEIGKRESWRTLVCNRGEGLFQLVEMWVEDRFMLEVMTPEQTERYIEITQPEFFAEALGITFPENAGAENLNLIG